MMKSYQLAGYAALLYGLIALGNLLIVFVWLGAEIMVDPAKVATVVITKPAPLLWLEFLKIAAAGASSVIVLVFKQPIGVKSGRIALFVSGCGLLAALLLALAGLVGGTAVLTATYRLALRWLPVPVTYTNLNTLINRLGLMAIFFQGLWLFGFGWFISQTHILTMGIAALSLLLATVNVITFVLPPLAILSLLLGLFWSFWLGKLLSNASRRVTFNPNNQPFPSPFDG